MSWANSKLEALTMRRQFKQNGRCSCIVKNRDGVHWYVSNCSINELKYCKPKLWKKLQIKKVESP